MCDGLCSVRWALTGKMPVPKGVGRARPPKAKPVIRCKERARGVTGLTGCLRGKKPECRDFRPG